MHCCVDSSQMSSESSMRFKLQKSWELVVTLHDSHIGKKTTYTGKSNFRQCEGLFAKMWPHVMTLVWHSPKKYETFWLKGQISSQGLRKEFDLYMLPGQNFHWLAKKDMKVWFSCLQNILASAPFVILEFLFFSKEEMSDFCLQKNSNEPWTFNAKLLTFHNSLKENFMSQFYDFPMQPSFAEKFLTLN